MKGKTAGPQVLTGNRLRDGAVAYRTAGGEWVTDISLAEVAPDAAAAERLTALAAEDVAARRVVGPYLIEVILGEAGLVAASHRERIRAAGPTIPYGPAERQLLAG